MRITIPELRKLKTRGEPIPMLTAYDATFGRLLDESGIEILLVGDSLGMVIQGHDTTLPVTLDEMIYHTRAVARVTRRAQVVGDMPFMSFQSSIDQALANAGRLVKEGGAHAVKLEGGAQHAELVTRLVGCGIPVMGHIGLTPQSYHQLGGFKIQGRKDGDAGRLQDDARALADAGAYSIVLEGIPHEIAREITATVSVPTIGIGAGPACDGQVLVIYDMLGMDDSFKPKFVRRYEHLATRIRTAVDAYIADVRDQTFPAEPETFFLTPEKRASPVRDNVEAIGLAGGCGPLPGATAAPSPAATTSAAGSCPSAIGAFRTMYQAMVSLLHSPQARMRTRTSPGPGAASGTGSIRMSSGP
jgi:3-methyl-2-oxobutanoate hydroxymethyltransferase